MGDPKAHVMARPLRAPLRRSFSDHIRDSTARALDVIWKNTRDRRLAEIEAKEACDWLRATGFPQYAQLYEAQGAFAQVTFGVPSCSQVF
ncbi:PREDICTED: rho GTPase-activating protein 7-like [Rhinopithecus bieti]|uniref:rho GTPase-activating protein 7-like n=1 Tax=Rhinopithecus bieti TaxID=61621 RepID=UPI00083BB277|nr:PREDICTED: rho GTPase-activating protein 7-like [Rhinopithecus bieti]